MSVKQTKISCEQFFQKFPGSAAAGHFPALQYSQIAVMSLSGTLSINIFRNFGSDVTKTYKYGRLPFMRFDILTMSVSLHAHNQQS